MEYFQKYQAEFELGPKCRHLTFHDFCSDCEIYADFIQKKVKIIMRRMKFEEDTTGSKVFILVVYSLRCVYFRIIFVQNAYRQQKLCKPL